MKQDSKIKKSWAQILSVCAVPFIAASVFFAFLIFRSPQPLNLPDYGPAPQFVMTDQNGVSFDSRALTGKPWIASFMFTRCPSACPLMTMHLGRLAKKNPGMNYVSFTSDPDYDKPEILKEFVGKGVGPKSWIFLTGDKPALKQTAESFLTALNDEPSLHSSKFFLVDAAGRIRGLYDSQSREQMLALSIDSKALIDAADRIPA